MHKARIAEWILAQVLSRDRAAATVGDLLEDTPQRGPIWFWQCVLRTTAAQVWHDLSGHPFLMARLGFWGFAKNMLVPVGTLALLFIIMVTSDTHTDIRYRHDWLFTWIVAFTRKNPADPGNLNFTWPLEFISHGLWATQIFRTSQWISRRMPGRQMALCLAVALTGWLVIFAEDFWWRYGTSLFRPRPALSAIPIGIAHDLILFAGAIWASHQKRSHTSRI